MFKTLDQSWGDAQSLLSRSTLWSAHDDTMLPFPSIKEDNPFIFSTFFFCFPLSWLFRRWGLHKAQRSRAPGRSGVSSCQCNKTKTVHLPLASFHWCYVAVMLSDKHSCRQTEPVSSSNVHEGRLHWLPRCHCPPTAKRAYIKNEGLFLKDEKEILWYTTYWPNI